MGDSYKLAIDGSSPGSLYGLAWSHPNAGGQAALGLNDHGLLVMNYGTTFAAISSRIWARDQMNAPIYYDRNTAFYLDGDSNSRLSHGRFVGSSGYYSLLLGPDTLATNGSTSVYPDGDRYGLVVNAPYYPHVYINSYADNGNTTHGGVLSFIGNLTSGGYRKFVMGIANRNPNEMSFGWFDNNYNPHYGVGINWSYPASVWYDTGNNWYARGSMRAPIFYDQDNTGFYLDPNSNASNCMRVSGGIHVSVGNGTGNGIILADDGDIVDLNDGYCAMRFSSGVRIHSANRGGGPNILLGNGGNIVAADNITAYGSPSDIRKKENIVLIENALEKVSNLRGVEFDWKEDTDEWNYTKLKHDVGFIAQEVQAVEPKLVREDVNGFLSVRDRGIPALLVEAVKELKQQLDEARAEIKELKEQLLKK
jgi:hypothetical protein